MYNGFIMNGPDAAKEIGITYGRLDYWIRKGVITPIDPGTRGRDRDFTPRDLELFRLAGLLRENKYPLEVIKFVIDCLNYWTWDIEKGPITVMIFALGHKKGSTGRAGAYTWDSGWTRNDSLGTEYKSGLVFEIPDWTYLVGTTFEPN